MKKILAVLLVLFTVSVVAVAQRLPETIIRVGVLINAASFNLSCEGDYYLYELENGRQVSIKAMDDYLVKGSGDEIRFGGRSFATPLRLVSLQSGEFIRINGRRYHDNILISCRNGKMTVVNELGLEDYICGILPKEVSPAWPEESLKAQAIVSRTYALRNLKRHEKDGFDICTNTHCQVYGGVESEDKRSNAAVEATKGEVLVCDGELVQAVFHACCAGYTEDPINVWAWGIETPKYLRGRRDKYCSNYPRFDWTNRISIDTIEAKLTKAGFKADRIRKISLSGEDGSGRANFIKIKTKRDTLLVPAAKFRMAMDPEIIRSTMFTRVTKRGDAFEFSGKGWGHGVGMCQWGAKEMAERGKECKEILEFYYPGAEVEKWDE